LEVQSIQERFQYINESQREKMKKNLFVVLFFTSAIFFVTIAQPVQFKTPIVIQSNAYVDTLWVGVSGDGPGVSILDNTYGLDVSKKYGKIGQWRELMYPPDFPKVKINAKFVNIPGRTEMKGNGLKPYDIRGYTNKSQIDTFAIRVYGDSLANNRLTLTWQSNLNEHGNAWQLLKRRGKNYMIVVRDMTAVTFYTDPNVEKSEQCNYLLIKTGVK